MIERTQIRQTAAGWGHDHAALTRKTWLWTGCLGVAVLAVAVWLAVAALATQPPATFTLTGSITLHTSTSTSYSTEAYVVTDHNTACTPTGGYSDLPPGRR